ncbi:actin-binding LIM protein 3 isoform X2 [Nematostella vectensis]|uniref:actin-binding LIM protein 3 isoform X2 n=1 Tax=Nematostella vectensis TaxID=45351 RepID=UPI002076D7CC|nr:actin-binding LIM protein 3 isoform X2 [Nematostella vectensis]
MIAEVLCRKCTKPCSGEALLHENAYYHENCLCCSVCGQGLRSKPFYVMGEQYYCKDDYQNQYGKKCDSCQLYLEGEIISIHGKNFHEACFACNCCRQPFPPSEKIIFTGTDYLCQTCNNAPKAPTTKVSSPYLHTCAGCGEAIKGSQALLALEKQWHLWCFSCTKCHCLLSLEYMGMDGKPYCEKDYQELFGVTCAACNGYITGKVLQAGNKHYHPKCSRCARCNNIFGEGEEMFLQGNEIWHPKCSDEAALEEKMRLEQAAAPQPPQRTAASRDWKDSKPARPHSYHDTASALRNYNPVKAGAVYRGEDGALGIKPKKASAPRIRRYSDENKAPLNASAEVPPAPMAYFSYDELVTTNPRPPKGVDKTKLETYLTDEEFMKVFSVTRFEFYAMPTWKRNNMKKSVDLF